MKKLFILLLAAAVFSSCEGYRYDNIYEDESLFPSLVVKLKEIKELTATSATVSFVYEGEEAIDHSYVNVAPKSDPEDYWSITSSDNSREQDFFIGDLEPNTEYLVRAIFVFRDKSYDMSFNKPFKTLQQP